MSFRRRSFAIIPALLLLAVVTSSVPAQRSDSDPRLRRYLEKNPAADANGDGVLTLDEARDHKRGPSRSVAKPAREEGSNTSPTHADIAYGPHERNRLDLWLAGGENPAPLVIYFHGGSFKAGDKGSVTGKAGAVDEGGAADRVAAYRDAGISVASANYRLSSDAPYPAPMHDGARAVQFLRANAPRWNIDPARIFVSGGSAGGTLALWLGLHDDLADPRSPDPVARQSTRVRGVIGLNAPCSMQPEFIAEHIGSENLGGAMLQLFGAPDREAMQVGGPVAELVRDASPISHLTPDDPPLLMIHNPDMSATPMPADTPQQRWIHHPVFSQVLQEACRTLGVPCDVYDKSRPASAAEVNFVLARSGTAARVDPPGSYVYRTLGERKLQLSPHYPAGWTPRDDRVAVLLFSGNHKPRTKDGMIKPLASEPDPLPVRNPGPGEAHSDLADSYADRGFVCFRVEYRSRGNDGVLPGEDLKDAFAAIRWVRTHAGELGIDPHRVIAVGCSSGGYLASGLYAFEPSPYGQEDPFVPARPDAIILHSPLVDWLRTGSMRDEFLIVLDGDEDLGARVSPARHWRPGQPPMLVFLGTEEPQFEGVRDFAETWAARGEPMELYLGEGGPHGFFGKGAWVPKVAARTDEFLGRIGYHGNSPEGATAGAPPSARPGTFVYKDIDGRPLRITFHGPADRAASDRRPAVLFFSGGGFNPNDKGTGRASPPGADGAATPYRGGFEPYAAHFAGRGLVTAEVEYRKRHIDGNLPDKAVEDAKSAMRWVRSHAKELGIDPDRIVSSGGSSGGCLAAAVASLPEFDSPTDDLAVSCRPNAMVLHFPLLDFLAGGTRTTPFLDALGGDRELGRRLSPAHHWSSEMPPTLVLIGTKDPMYDTLRAFASKWQAAGGEVDIYVGAGGGHGFSTNEGFRAAAIERMDQFLQGLGYVSP